MNKILNCWLFSCLAVLLTIWELSICCSIVKINLDWVFLEFKLVTEFHYFMSCSSCKKFVIGNILFSKYHNINIYINIVISWSNTKTYINNKSVYCCKYCVKILPLKILCWFCLYLKKLYAFIWSNVSQTVYCNYWGS